MESVSPAANSSDKVFNLQLTIQKLEEELSYYRNGTNSSDLFELLQEKESEITVLQSKLTSKEETLLKITKASSEVLMKYDLLNNEKLSLTMQINDLTVKLNELEVDLLNKNNDIMEFKNKVNELAAISREKDVAIATLKDTISICDENINKLHKRCADLVIEKNAKTKLVDSEKLEMIKQIQSFKESMKTSLNQRDEVIIAKDIQIRELKHKLQLQEGTITSPGVSSKHMSHSSTPSNPYDNNSKKENIPNSTLSL
eukprot:gene5034-7025_t